MAERLNRCPKCGVVQYTDLIVKAHNPETLDMNMEATLRCGGPAPEVKWKGKVLQPSHTTKGCGHEWEGRVSSPNHQKMRERGWVI